MMVSSWNSDRVQERHWHLAAGLLFGAIGLGLTAALNAPAVGLAALTLAGFGVGVATAVMWPVVIGYARRDGMKFHFKVGVQDIIYPQDWKPQDDPLRYITQRYTKAIEDMVRAEPGQYLWVHRRWKTRPKGEAPETYD